MSDDLIKRLAGHTWYTVDATGKRCADDAPKQAAAALAEAQAEIARLEAALRPFAQEHAWSPHSRFKIVLAGPEGDITGADLDRARAALEAKHG